MEERMMEKFRTLRADEIDCRVATVKSAGVTLLLYKDARCDMNILDETVGPLNWQRSHSRENANCTVSIWDDDRKQWVSKEDTGTESFTEKEKGLASDSFKRACFNWGIGRELYTAPFIFVKSGDCKVESKRSGSGYTCNDHFYVSDIGYDDNRVINRLQIRHQKSNKVVFDLGKKESEETEEPSPIDELKKKCESHNIDLNEWAKQWGKNKTVNNLTDSEIDRMLLWIRDNFGDE
jgi:hypothetical protein